MGTQNSVMCLSWISIYVCVFVECKSLNDSKTLIKDILSDHQKNARPTTNQDEPVIVTVNYMYIKSIQEFDEVQEKFSYIAALDIGWMDDGITWDPEQYGEIKDIVLSYLDVWVPDLILSIPFEEVKPIGEKWQNVRYFSTGHANWFPGALIETTCPVNARNYPFDTQICTSTFKLNGYTEKEINIIARENKISLIVFSENGAWTLENTFVQSFVSSIDFTFHLKRKPAYVVINVLLPIIVLSFLNGFVFLLVPESGERVSFCITVLLSVAVFLTIISDTLPKSSEPVPIISYMLMVDMVKSSLITLVTILNLRLYNKDETQEKPRWIVSLHTCMFQHKNCGRDRECQKSADKTEITNETMLSSNSRCQHCIEPMVRDDETENPKDVGAKVKIVKSVSCTCTYDRCVTWKQISLMIDVFALLGFSFAAVSTLVIFIVLTYLG